MIDSNQPVVAHFGIPIKFTLGTLRIQDSHFGWLKKLRA